MPHNSDNGIHCTYPKIAVIIATCDRSEMLSDRSIPSVLNQSIAPDIMLIVDDSRSSKIRLKNTAYVESLQRQGMAITIIPNRRTPGACGAWNTGIDCVFKQTDSPENTFLAILDDDDSWHPTYLEKCIQHALSGPYDLVAADIVRIEYQNTKPIETPGPTSLKAEDFLVGNPGIQGSNIFLRLSIMLMAGCFDESLRSCTDRDLCIRLADLSIVRFARIPEGLVDHYAEPERVRLSTLGSESKLSGLDTFWSKYGSRMSQNQRLAFSERTSSLFHWQPPSTLGEFAETPKSLRTALVLGLMSSSPFFDTVLHSKDERIVGLDVVLCETEHDSEFAKKVAALRMTGIGCFPLERDLQKSIHLRPTTALERYCHAVAHSRIGAEVWVIDGCPDDDVTIELLNHLQARRSPASGINIKSDAIEQMIQVARIETADLRIRTLYSCNALRLLGSGSEAVVFTDGNIVYKCIDYWKTRIPENQIKFLQAKIGSWNDHPGLYSLHDVRVDGTWVIITYDYETSTPYKGGHEEGLLKLLTSCHNVGIVCNNIAPKNLILTDEGVSLIDYGSDIRHWSELGFERMARRAFLTCNYAENPRLPELLQSSLHDLTLPEMIHYPAFRAQLNVRPTTSLRNYATSWMAPDAPVHAPFNIVIGVISSEPLTLWPLLQSIDLQGISAKVLVLDNGSPLDELALIHSRATKLGFEILMFDQQRQQRDAQNGLFGRTYLQRPLGKVGIAHARSMIQRYLGQEIADDPNAVGWLLDDDMRIDERAKAYLRWLPALRTSGVDIVIGAYEGSSPNPPLNGLRVQLVDLLCNIRWLDGLPLEETLLDRSEENRHARLQYPEYYYDLSRKHTAHLEQPHWIEPIAPNETVREAISRILHDANHLLDGVPLTRPLVANTPLDPVSEAQKSVNRGGCTFILNSNALTLTPNTITLIHGREARRSDMLWAIVNHYYRGLVIKAIGFPVDHVARKSSSPSLNLDKVQGEIVGSTLYAGLMSFLTANPEHTLVFTDDELDEIELLCEEYLQERLMRLEMSFFRIRGLSKALSVTSAAPLLAPLLAQLENWFTDENWNVIRQGATALRASELRVFLRTLRNVADDFAASGN